MSENYLIDGSKNLVPYSESGKNWYRYYTSASPGTNRILITSDYASYDMFLYECRAIAQGKFDFEYNISTAESLAVRCLYRGAIDNSGVPRESAEMSNNGWLIVSHGTGYSGAIIGDLDIVFGYSCWFLFQVRVWQ